MALNFVEKYLIVGLYNYLVSEVSFAGNWGSSFCTYAFVRTRLSRAEAHWAHAILGLPITWGVGVMKIHDHW